MASRSQWSLVCRVAGVWCGLIAAAVLAGEGLAPNMSFEDGRGDQPAHWRFYSWKDSQGRWDSQHAHSGKKSLWVRGPNGGWSATVPVAPDKIYQVQFHYRAEHGPSRIVLYVRTPERKPRVLLYLPIVTIPHDKKAQFIDGDYVPGADERGWGVFDGGQFRTEPGANAVAILIKFRGESPEAQVWLDDVVITPMEQPSLPRTSAVLQRLPGGVVWTDSENRKIFPDQPAPEGPDQEGVALRAAKGEVESFQIAVTPREDWQAAKWTWQDFSGPAPLAGRALRCRRVECVRIERTMGPHTHRGLNPDALTDRLPCDLPPGQTQSFWFTLRIPATQAQGEYQTRLALVSGDRELCSVPLRLRVRGFAIPARPSLDVRSSFRTSLIFPRETGDRWDVLQRYYRDFYDHRSRCAPGARLRVRLRGDSAEIDGTEYLRHVRFLRDELGARRLNVPSLWIGHRGAHTMPPDAQWMGRPIFANPALTALSPGFEKPFRSYMGQFVALLKKNGLFLEPTVRFFDEPRLSHGPTRAALRVLSELLLDIDPGLTVAMTASDPHPELTGVAKLWILHTDAWHRNLPRIRAAQAAGCKIGVYNNGVNLPEQRRLRVRLWPWLLHKYRVDGTYSWWGTVCWRGPVADPWTAGEGSSGVLLYPPRSPQEHGPIDSVRWELFREGLEDYEYMRLAEQLAGEAQAAGQPDLAQRGRQAVADALKLVRRWPRVRAANDEPYALDVRAVAQARSSLADAIEAMTAAAQERGPE